MNGATFDPSEQEYGDLALAVATGQATKDDVTAFFRKHVRTA